MMVDLSRLTTEQRNPATMDLDQMSPLEIAVVMNQEDKKAVLAVQQVLPQVATAIQWAADSLRQGGRLIYMGPAPAVVWAFWTPWSAHPPSALRRRPW